MRKEVGYSWVDAGMKDELHLHRFSSDDRSHLQAEEICRVAECLWFDMRVLEEQEQGL